MDDDMAEPNLGLFDNERETNLESTIAMIEDVLVELGHFINNCRVDQPGAIKAWRFKKGSAEVLLALVHAEDFTHLRAACTIMSLDDGVDRSALFARLLELNESALCGAAFGLKANQIRLVAERSTRDLDRSEVASLVGNLENYADDYDEQLVAQFGGTLGGPALI
ncbi:MAG: YbjN domain-containing protein [Deltaproteobacteria bacterium]|jgi:hypothetical protein|nr:YbjN domain-containing protein [Deltaproteobacteria bacterium]